GTRGTRRGIASAHRARPSGTTVRSASSAAGTSLPPCASRRTLGSPPRTTLTRARPPPARPTAVAIAAARRSAPRPPNRALRAPRRRRRTRRGRPRRAGRVGRSRGSVLGPPLPAEPVAEEVVVRAARHGDDAQRRLGVDDRDRLAGHEVLRLAPVDGHDAR